MNTEVEINYREYVMRETGILHAPYENEVRFYRAVAAGDINYINERYCDTLTKKEGMGILSDDDIRNNRYHFIIATAMLARYCMASGMPHEEAYHISDIYIRKVDVTDDIHEISKLHKQMSLEYTRRMQKIKSLSGVSKPISRCLNYIYDHLHEKITLSDIAEYVGLSSCYISRLFSSEMGESVTDYIRRKKLETAATMLAESEYAVSDIAQVLAFPSQSHFTHMFVKQYNVTPLSYRKKHSHVLM